MFALRSPVKLHMVTLLGIGMTFLLSAIYDTQVEFSITEVNKLDDDEAISGFLVHSYKCSIPDFSPYHPTIVKFIKRWRKLSCFTAPPMTNIEGTTLLYHPEHASAHIAAFMKKQEKKGQKKANLEETVINVTESDPAACCYRSVERVTQPANKYNGRCDKSYSISELCTPITEPETPILHEAILVVCQAKGNVVYKNLHILVQRDILLDRRLKNIELINDLNRTDTNATLKNSEKNSTEDLRRPPKRYPADQNDSAAVLNDRTSPLPHEEQLNVLMIMFDAVSRLNFYRQMPKTADLLSRLGAFDMAGYNKVGDNTYPNLVALLTGFSKQELRNHSCLTQRKIKVFDDCPFIWKDFRRKGYVTGFMEDSPWMNTFNYNSYGFREQPTEFYPRQFFQVSEAEAAWMQMGNSKQCQGPKMSIEVVLDSCLAMTKAFPDVPFFGLFVSSSITHDYLNLAWNADLPSMKLLEEIHDMGILNKTALVVFSDHGQRWGSIRSTFVGMMEERLPLMFILLPEWFRDRHPAAYTNMQVNSRRLTSNFDIHATLRDIAFGHYADQDYVTRRPLLSRGISLFQKIPKHRSCEEAGIPDHFCTCHNSRPLPLNETVAVRGAEFIMNTLNRDLQNYTLCIQFTKIELLSAGLSESGTSLKPKGDTSELRTYLLQGRLAPGGGEVEATLHYDPTTQAFELAGEISRINAYGSQSHCISNATLRKYCYCRDMLRNE